ncbi:hypothetical protein ACJJTC_011287 [Scirpophaga incertulas]
MSSRDRDAGRKFESAENIPSTSSWVPPLPPLSLSKNSEGDVEVTTSLPLRSLVPPSTLSSQDHESEPESMLTSMTAEIENLNPQNDPALHPLPHSTATAGAVGGCSLPFSSRFSFDE